MSRPAADVPCLPCCIKRAKDTKEVKLTDKLCDVSFSVYLSVHFLSISDPSFGIQNNKTYFANERTFIHWLNMYVRFSLLARHKKYSDDNCCTCRAVTLGAISSALVAFGRKEDAAGIYSVSIEAQIMAGCLVTTASAFTLYASEHMPNGFLLSLVL